MSELSPNDPVWIAGPDVSDDEAADAAVEEFFDDLGL